MAENTIKLAVYGIPPVELEIEAAGTITPGMLVVRGPLGTVVAHNVSGALASNGSFTKPSLIAVENLMEGKSIYDNYVLGEKVYIIGSRPGDLMWMWLALGQTTVIGDLLVSDGAGMLEVAPAAPWSDGQIVGTAIEVVDASAAAMRIKVEIA